LVSVKFGQNRQPCTLLHDVNQENNYYDEIAGNIIGIGNPYIQAIQIIKNIQTALQAVDASVQLF
jgi:hypothetical protein